MKLIELNKLEQYLIDNGIPYERIDDGEELFDRHQICVPGFDPDKRKWDAICQKGSYGAEEGLLEIYGTIVDPNAGDTVEGWLTADDVIERINKAKGEKKDDNYATPNKNAEKAEDDS